MSDAAQIFLRALNVESWQWWLGGARLNDGIIASSVLNIIMAPSRDFVLNKQRFTGLILCSYFIRIALSWISEFSGSDCQWQRVAEAGAAKHNIYTEKTQRVIHLNTKIYTMGRWQKLSHEMKVFFRNFVLFRHSRTLVIVYYSVDIVGFLMEFLLFLPYAAHLDCRNTAWIFTSLMKISLFGAFLLTIYFIFRKF